LGNVSIRSISCLNWGPREGCELEPRTRQRDSSLQTAEGEIDLLTVLDQQPIRISFKDANGRFYYINRECAKAFGLTDSRQAIGGVDTDYFADDCIENAREEERTVIETGHPILNREELEIWKDGKETWGLTSKYPLRDKSGKIIGVVVHTVDITESKTELLRLRAAVEGSQDGLWYRDLSAGNIWFSRRWKEVLGYTEDEFPNDRGAWLALIHPDDRPGLEAEIEGYLGGRLQAYDYEYRIRHKDGTYRWIHAKGKRRTEDSGSESFAGSHSDITNQRNRDQFHLQVLDTVPTLIWVKDGTQKLTFANQAFADACGLPKEQVLGKRDADLVPLQAKRFGRDDQRVLRTGKPLEISEEVVTGADGVKRVLAARKVPLPAPVNALDQSISILGVATDITKLRKAKEDLKLERELFNNLMDSIPDGIFFKDSQSRFTRVSKALAEMVGRRSPRELIGKTDRDFFDDEYANAALAEERNIFATGNRVLNVVRRTPTKKGPQWRLVTKVPIKDARGRVVRIAGISRNITDVTEANELVNTVFDSVPQCIWIKDVNGRFLKCNRSYAKRHGYDDPKDVVGKTDFNHWPKRQAQAYQRTDKDLLKRGRSKLHAREEQLLKDGRHAILDTSKIPLQDASGKPTKLLCICEDITERLQDEKFSIHRDVQVSIGHCFKHWLRSIEDRARELRAQVPQLNGEKSWVLMEEAHQYLWRATETSIYFTALDGGFQAEEVALLDTVESAVRVLNDNRISVSPGSTSPRCIGSPFHLQNAILEILSNARREVAPKRGRIRVDVSEEEMKCFIYITDNGPGIPKDLQGKEFELFAKGDRSRTGLGLAYVREVCKAHGGNVRSISAKMGAHFVIELPAKGSAR